MKKYGIFEEIVFGRVILSIEIQHYFVSLPLTNITRIVANHLNGNSPLTSPLLLGKKKKNYRSLDLGWRVEKKHTCK